MTDTSDSLYGQHNGESAETFTCIHCGAPYRRGELSCPQCGRLFGSSGTTQRLKVSERAAMQSFSSGRGDAFVSNPQALVFEIGKAQITLPVGDNVIVGRATHLTDHEQPDVDLSAFDAEEQGVSRCHIRIRYRDILTYVTDLDSSNGTYLNGRRLMAQNERLLRSGDELQLGQLRMRVKF